jgi:uncharacterized protein with ParB-like and HNH nuclease domain
MSYRTVSVKDMINRINSNNLLLPALQRNFVWNRKRIESYFDSLYRSFPLGNFIFWNLENGLANRYPLYQFIREYNERSQEANPKPARNILSKSDLWAVIDGQQRLSSLYIGLTGTYKYKKAGKGMKDTVEHHFVNSRLYFNLMHVNKRDKEDSEGGKLFSFKSDSESQHLNEANLWIEVGKILQMESPSDINLLIAGLTRQVTKSKRKVLIQRFNDRKKSIKETVSTLHEKLTSPLLSYYEVVDNDIDEVIEIFVRVNSGGLQLKKAELLFSTIAAEWNEARDKIDSLIDSLEEYELYVDRDFVMRVCLMLSDLPIKYKIETFNKRNIRKIIENWQGIEHSLLELGKNLHMFGYKNFPNLSDRALIPIAYYIFKGGDYKAKHSIRNIWLYYVTSQVKNIFGGQNDIILGRIREALRFKKGSDYILKSKKFDFDTIKEVELPARKSFKIDKTYIEQELAEEGYGANAYFLLSLICPSIDFSMKRYELDHIHPKKKMSRPHLTSIGLSSSEIDWILDNFDNLPNIELLTSQDNIRKKAKPFKEFIAPLERTERLRFLFDNLIPGDQRLWELRNFRKFYELRKSSITKQLMRVFK